MAEGADGVSVVAEAFQSPANPARDLGAAGVGKARELGIVGDGHDAGDDWQVDAGVGAVVDESEVGLGIVEVLGDGRVGAGIDLALKVFQVGRGRCCLGMEFGVGRDLDMESVAELLAQKAHQFVGVAEGAEPGAPHAGRKVAAEGDDAGDALLDIMADDVADLGLVRADAGEVRGGFDALATQPGDCLEGALAGGAASAVGAREV